MSKWTITFEIDDIHYFRCEGCPILMDNSNCDLQDENFDSFEEQLESCPLKEVVE